jgi:prefoldin subunit 5
VGEEMSWEIVAWVMIIINIILSIGWGYTISKSMKRCLEFYNNGFMDCQKHLRKKK